jgi:hypothetical protein
MTIRQCIAARDKAKLDPRYKKRRSADPHARALRTQATLMRERERDARKGKKKK